MGGLLAARVLADFFRTVTVVERDEFRMMPRIGAAYRRVGTFTFCCRAVPRSWMSCFKPMYESTEDRICAEP